MSIQQILLKTALLIVFLGGCENPAPDHQQKKSGSQVTLSLGHDLPEESTLHAAALMFAKEVKQSSKGQIQVKIHPNQTLGTDRQMLAMAQQGKLDIIIPPTAKLSHIIPELQVFDLPFLFPNAKTAHKALDGKVGSALLAKFEEHNLLGIAFWEGGFKQLTSNKPITNVEDLKTLRFRIMQSNVIRDQFSSWGADSVAIEFSKTYNALKEKIVDGQENPLNSIIGKKFYDVQKYLYLSRHGYLAQAFVASQLTFNQLSKKHQRIIVSSALKTTLWQREEARKKHQDQLKFIQSQSIEVAQLPVDVKQYLQQKSSKVLETHRMKFGTEIIEGILQAVNEDRVFKDDELVIAIDADMSGNSALSGLAIKRGIALAVDEINQSGGVLGKSLVVIARDNSMIPARGLDNLKKFSQIPNLLAVFGGISSPVLLAELEYIHQNKLLMLDPWAAATPIIDNGYDPNFVFRVSVRDEFAADFLLENALNVSDQVGLLLVDNGWGRSNYKALIDALNKKSLEPTHTEWFEWGKADFSRSISRLYDAGTQVIVYVGNPVEAAKMLAELSQKPQPIPVISHWGITGGYFSTLAKEALKKVDLRILQTFSFIGNKEKNVIDFVTKYKAKYAIKKTSDIVAPVGTAHAYDLTHLLVKAVKSANSVDSEKVRVALESIKAHSGLVKDYHQPFTKHRHDALGRKDFILTVYKDNYLVPYVGQKTSP